MVSVKADITNTESRDKKDDVHTSYHLQGGAGVITCTVPNNKNNLIVFSKCNSAILLWPLPCIVLASITVKEHMVLEPESGSQKVKKRH